MAWKHRIVEQMKITREMFGNRTGHASQGNIVGKGDDVNHTLDNHSNWGLGNLG